MSKSRERKKEKERERIISREHNMINMNVIKVIYFSD